MMKETACCKSKIDEIVVLSNKQQTTNKQQTNKQTNNKQTSKTCRYYVIMF